MKKKISRLVIIPARGGSKRIKNKNLKKFHNKPLISYAINALKDSKLFNKIHISSDSTKILNYCKKLGIKTDFVRPKFLAGDKTPLAPVIEYVIKEYLNRNIFFNQVWLVYATNPFINKTIIQKCEIAFRQMQKSPQNALMTVTKFADPIYWAQSINKRGHLMPIFKNKLKIRSQDFTDSYCDAGMINIYHGEKFTKKINKKINYYPFEVKGHKSFDIDTKEDFVIASKLFKL